MTIHKAKASEYSTVKADSVENYIISYYIVEGTPKSTLFSVGYCDMAYLLRYHSPIAYTCGVYGWNFDVYEIHGLTICTGYRGMPGRTANNVRKYEQAARDVVKRLDQKEAEQE